MKLYGWVGLITLIVSEICLFRKIEPFHSWFYCFAWWSFILLADNLLLRLRGRSLLTSRRGELRSMLPLSVFVWLIFEAYNLIVRNWGYDGVPSEMWLRWPGYAFAFATVLPGIFITSDLLDLLFGPAAGAAPSECECLAEQPNSAPSRVFLILGILLSVAPLVWPRYFFAAIWLGPIFLLDPMLERVGLKSLALGIAARERRRIWSLLLGGLACGAMWEFWNFWAASRWVYTVPFFGSGKVFEMPVMGFLGFPPFALECWILYHLLAALARRCSAPPARAAFWLAIGIFSALVMTGIDSHTVIRFTSRFEGSMP